MQAPHCRQPNPPLTITPNFQCARGRPKRDPGAGDLPGYVRLDSVFLDKPTYHNFLRPHMGLGGMTSAEKAGIMIPGPDKLPTLIRCAAASRFNPT